MRDDQRDGRAFPRASRHQALAGLLATVALGLALIGLLGCGGGETPSSSAVAPEKVDSDVKVLLIALDGATWRILDPMMERGELENIARLVEQGTRAEFQTLKPTLSPIIWTTIAVGKLPVDHGIRGFWRKRGAGEAPVDEAEQAMIDRLKSIGYIGGGDPESEGSGGGNRGRTLYKSTDWKTRALWQIIGERGLESTILGWWVTYPVIPINGVMVSDRYLFNRFELEAQESGRGYTDKEQNVHPPELEPRLRRSALAVEDIDRSWIERFVDGPVRVDQEMVLHDPIDELRIALAKDTSYHRMGLDLLSERSPDLFAIYYQGVDIASHYFWKYMFPEEWEAKYPAEPVDPREIERYEGVIAEYYRLLDGYIGELLAHADERTMVMLMSDHGFDTGRRDENSGLASETVSGVHAGTAPEGVLLISGYGAKKGGRLDRASVLDITPTLLAVYGLPVAGDMEGRVLLSALEPSAFSYPLPASFIESYEPRQKAER